MHLDWRRPHVWTESFTAILICCLGLTTACRRQAPVHIGEKFTLGDLTYIVKSTRSQYRFTVPSLGEGVDAGHDATFFLVEMEIANNGKLSTRIIPTDFELETADGKKYSPDIQGTSIYPLFERHGFTEFHDSSLLQPRIPIPYAIVFRVPTNVVRNRLVLIVHEQAAFFFGGATAVALQ